MSHPLAPVLAAFTAAHPDTAVAAVEDAYHLAETWHRNEFRRSGDPFITHPVEVSLIVAKHGARAEIVCAALLHDTGYAPEWLRDRFSPDVLALVTGLRQLDDGALAGASDDVLLLKLADRLHNMRTIRFVDPARQRRKAAETLTTLVPVATRLGAHGIGRELSSTASAVLGQDTASLRTLSVASTLLPAAVRSRWIAEWAGELAVLTTRKARLRFVAALVLAMPKLACNLRRRPKSS